MDVLADASLAALTHESDAAQILTSLFDRREGACGAAEDQEGSLASPRSVETVDLPPPPPPPNTHPPQAQAQPHPWARSEDDLLRRLAAARTLSLPAPTKSSTTETCVESSDETLHTWEDIASQFNGRTAAQCASRYKKVLNPENIKGAPYPHHLPLTIQHAHPLLFSLSHQSGHQLVQRLHNTS